MSQKERQPHALYEVAAIPAAELPFMDTGAARGDVAMG
jgi:hypothetical protein